MSAEERNSSTGPGATRGENPGHHAGATSGLSGAGPSIDRRASGRKQPMSERGNAPGVEGGVSWSSKAARRRILTASEWSCFRRHIPSRRWDQVRSFPPRFRPEVTKWPFTTHKRPYQERDARIVALDQAFGNFLIFRWLAGGDGNQVIPDTDRHRPFKVENEPILYAKNHVGMSNCTETIVRWFPTGGLFSFRPIMRIGRPVG